MGKGIDYGLGTTNIDKETGIRFGVIPLHDLGEWAIEEFEADYGPPTCGKCGNEAVDPDEDKHGDYEEGPGSRDYACEACERIFDSDEAYGDEPVSHGLDSGGYQATLGSDGDIFVTKSPYFTRAAFCSPCAPGACYLLSPDEDGERCYCFGHEWFESGQAPYPVFSVETGKPDIVMDLSKEWRENDGKHAQKLGD